MYLEELKVRNFRQFGEGPYELHICFSPGVNALVGRNDSGKSAVIDAIRYALLTRDQGFIRIEPEDFHIDKSGKQANEIFISCKLAGLSDDEKGTFIEYLSYDGDDVLLYVNWSARKLSKAPASRRWVDVSVESGIGRIGSPFESSVRNLLSPAYLRPLRDAERELSPGQRSRLSQILFNVPVIRDGEKFQAENVPQSADAVSKLGLVGLLDYMRHNVKQHSGVKRAQDAINEQYLNSLSLRGDDLQGKIDISEGGTEDARLRQILELLRLGLNDAATGSPLGRFGLGSNNLLFMACELLLLGTEPDGLPLLLIEEPEAHLHPQRQLRLIEFLVEAAKPENCVTSRAVQVVLSTHSPNLASKIPLANLILLEGQHAFTLAHGQTMLEAGDYRFLERFLDVTKANLFFAHGVLIVEGFAEAILLPVFAKLIDRDLTEHGVSIVNVSGKGLRRFSRIFQSKNQNAPSIGVRVACIADLDVMPDCAPTILGLVSGDDDETWLNSKRRWKAQRDFANDSMTAGASLGARRERLKADDAQSVRTFVSEYWTLEYDLARCGLAEQVFVAAWLAKNEGSLVSDAVEKFVQLKMAAGGSDDTLCSHIYRIFHKGECSKAVAAQHLAEVLTGYYEANSASAGDMRSKLPAYLVDAIDYVTGASLQRSSTTTLSEEKACV